jgi:hypothetical protein
MKLRLIGYSIILFITAMAAKVDAQSIYRGEIGINGGISYHLGDANTTFFKNSHLAYGAIYRFKLGSRFGIHANWDYTTIAGSKITQTPTATEFKYTNSVHAIDFCGEFNFFDFENKPYKPFSQKFSTFLYAGLGYMLYDYDKSQVGDFAFPFGIGMKLILTDKWNMNLMWTQRLLVSDKLEGIPGLDNAAGLNGTNIFNKDLLSTLTVGFTYNIFQKDCDCNNNHIKKKVEKVW